MILSAELVFTFMGARIRQVTADPDHGMVVLPRNLVSIVLSLSLATLSDCRALPDRGVHRRDSPADCPDNMNPSFLPWETFGAAVRSGPDLSEWDRS
jgi:hypothetical protein